MTSQQIPNPKGQERGVDLDLLVSAINQTNLKAKRDGARISIQHEHFETHIRVMPPPQSSRLPIQAVVTVRTGIPDGLDLFFDKADAGSEFNQFATLGALSKSADGYRVESRLTIFEGENAWNIHFPLLMFTAIASAESILGGLRRSLTGQGSQQDIKSKWISKDLRAVKDRIEDFSFCNADGLGLTAEFGLEPGANSKMMGHKTALYQLAADQPHPELGGGLFCLLNMPHWVDSKERLLALTAELNRLEMSPADQPPHFGAWCIGKSGNNVAYVSFLPNSMHEIPGIAVNMAVWAIHRAQWADGQIRRILSLPVQSRK